MPEQNWIAKLLIAIQSAPSGSGMTSQNAVPPMPQFGADSGIVIRSMLRIDVHFNSPC